MKEDEIIVQVQKINSEFYHAFENLSIERMERLWKHEDNVVCIHPGWDLFIGWLAIRESWITIFHNTEMIKFIITNTKVRVFDNIAVVVCLENIETLLDGEIVRLGVMATNIFEQIENQWLLIHHHGSSVSNYIPPNISF
ncbi:MAG: nuclear transport factor 2 family protein [Candidatus Nitrosopolaris sp.]